LHGRQQQGNQNADDRDDHEQFNQCEAASSMHVHVSLRLGVFARASIGFTVSLAKTQRREGFVNEELGIPLRSFASSALLHDVRYYRFRHA
jgi:hypothetical protein